MEKFILFIVGIVLVIALSLLEAWCLKVVYNFVAPFFYHDAPKMDIWIAFGILVIINIIAQPFKTSK